MSGTSRCRYFRPLGTGCLGELAGGEEDTGGIWAEGGGPHKPHRSVVFMASPLPLLLPRVLWCPPNASFPGAQTAAPSSGQCFLKEGHLPVSRSHLFRRWAVQGAPVWRSGGEALGPTCRGLGDFGVLSA